MKSPDSATIRSALQNLAEDTSDEYCRGLLVGIMTALVACGWSTLRAMNLIAICLPNDWRSRNDDTFPPTLLEHLRLRDIPWRLTGGNSDIRE